MSVQRLTAAFEIEDTSPAAKLVMIYLADRSSRLQLQVEFWTDELAEFACVTEQTALRLLDDLVYKGHLASWNEYEGNGEAWFIDYDEQEKSKQSNLSKSKRDYILDRDVDCIYCGCKEGPYHVDHIVPKSRGGSDEYDNLGLACATCNVSKRDKLIHEWRGRKDVEICLQRAERILSGESV